GDQLREEGQVCRQGREGLGGRRVAPVHVYGVAERLENVEGDAHGEDYVQGRKCSGPGESEEPRGRFDAKVCVLEIGKNGQIDEDGYRHRRLATQAAGGWSRLRAARLLAALGDPARLVTVPPKWRTAT